MKTAIDIHDYSRKHGTNSFEAVANICAHRVKLRYWGIQAEMTDEIIDRLTESAEEDVRRFINDGYHSGTLYGCIVLGPKTEKEVHGWWEIECDC